MVQFQKKLSVIRVNLVIIMSLKQPAPESLGTPSKRACKVLTLCKKVKVIDAVNGGMSHRNTAIKFGVGCTQISNIMQDQQNINKLYIKGNNANTKYLAPRALQYAEIDEECWKIFCEARSKNIPVNGLQRLMRLHYNMITITLVLQMDDCQDFQQDNK